MPVRTAEQPEADRSLGDHRVYIADRKVEIATAQAQTRFLEDQRAESPPSAPRPAGFPDPRGDVARRGDGRRQGRERRVAAPDRCRCRARADWMWPAS